MILEIKKRILEIKKHILEIEKRIVRGEILFKNSSHSIREFGFWPFLAICVTVFMISLIWSLYDRKVVTGDSV